MKYFPHNRKLTFLFVILCSLFLAEVSFSEGTQELEVQSGEESSLLKSHDKTTHSTSLLQKIMVKAGIQSKSGMVMVYCNSLLLEYDVRAWYSSEDNFYRTLNETYRRFKVLCPGDNRLTAIYTHPYLGKFLSGAILPDLEIRPLSGSKKSGDSISATSQELAEITDSSKSDGQQRGKNTVTSVTDGLKSQLDSEEKRTDFSEGDSDLLPVDEKVYSLPVSPSVAISMALGGLQVVNRFSHEYQIYKANRAEFDEIRVDTVGCKIPEKVRLELPLEDHNKIILRCQELSPHLFPDYDSEHSKFLRLRFNFFQQNALNKKRLSIDRGADFVSAYAQQIEGDNTSIENVSYNGEPGIDAGGLYREFFGVLGKSFSKTEDSQVKKHYLFIRDPNSKTDFFNSEWEQSLRASKSDIGRSLANIIKNERLIDQNAGYPFKLDFLDQLYGSGQPFRNYFLPRFELNFGVLYYLRFLGKDVSELDIKAAWLLEDDDAKLGYMQKLKNFGYAKSTVTDDLDDLEDFFAGFHQVIPPEGLVDITPQDLELMFRGPQFIEEKQMIQYMISDDSMIKRWWKKMVREELNTLDMRRAFLRTVTGAPILSNFEIKKVLEAMGPNAHTCFNTLDVPNFRSYEDFRDAILDLMKIKGFNNA